MSSQRPRRLGILTSGGDAPGMNAVVRSAVRATLDKGLEIFAVTDGLQGLVEGGEKFRKMTWDSVGGILHQGGTVIGSARSSAFRTREGRLQAARNLVRERIDGLIVIGGDGTLTGADTFRREWPGYLSDLVKAGELTAEQARSVPRLAIVGMVGSIDNDMAGTDMTIGADTALHRIVEALDALSSTAASHQRTFIVEVMGRDCGYLALMSALATGASWVLIPESPPDVESWEERMCTVLDEGRKAGRRHSTVIVAEGARDRNNVPISSERVRQVLQERLGLEARVTVLGHVQRGGAPSAFDRVMGTLLGVAAVDELLASTPDDPPSLIGQRDNRVTRSPLMENVRTNRDVSEAIAAKDFERAMDLRGAGFRSTFRVHRTMVRALPHPPAPGIRRLRLAVMNAGAPAPGMNTAVRTAVRLGLDSGHTVVGVRNGFVGLAQGDLFDLDWMSVHGWVSQGGARLGTNRGVPVGEEIDAIAQHLSRHQVEGILVIGGWAAYLGAYALLQAREEHPALRIPIVCLPATIDNNLPGTELSIGADTALNSIIEAVDKIKQSAVASSRCFVVEVMGRYCGYLAMMSGLAAGAERVYLHEKEPTLADLEADLKHLLRGFKGGKRLGLIIRNEKASSVFDTAFLRALFEKEGAGLFDARQAILGHLQQGGNPTPFDRIEATRLAASCVEWLVAEAEKESPGAAFIGFSGGRIQFFPLADLPAMSDMEFSRPKQQWWLELEPIARLLAQPAPSAAP